MKAGKIIGITLTVLLIAAMTGVIIWLSMWISDERGRADSARLQVENEYRNALYDSFDSVCEMENDLAKMLVSASEGESVTLAADVYKNAGAASEAAGRLPIDTYEHSGLIKFLNQVGDFAGSYIRAVGSGADTAAYNEQLENIYAATENVRMSLADAMSRLGDGDYSVLSQIDAGEMMSIGTGEMSIEYPSIIYDGPFSDSVDKCEWKTLSGLGEIGETDATAIVKDKLDMNGRVTAVTGGDAELYLLEGSISGRDAYASVTKRGGLIVSLIVNAEEGGRRLDEKAASEKALDYAARLGYCKSLTPVWYTETGGTAVVNLAPEKEGVVFYTDLVKVKVGLDDGSLLGIEGCGYCTNYCERSLPTARMTEASARACVSDRLKVTSVRLAVIPKGTGERFCYEVAGHYKGLDYFVYVDAVTGKQLDIMRVVDDEQGRLVV